MALIQILIEFLQLLLSVSFKFFLLKHSLISSTLLFLCLSHCSFGLLLALQLLKELSEVLRLGLVAVERPLVYSVELANREDISQIFRNYYLASMFEVSHKCLIACDHISAHKVIKHFDGTFFASTNYKPIIV